MMRKGPSAWENDDVLHSFGCVHGPLIDSHMLGKAQCVEKARPWMSCDFAIRALRVRNDRYLRVGRSMSSITCRALQDPHCKATGSDARGPYKDDPIIKARFRRAIEKL